MKIVKNPLVSTIRHLQILARSSMGITLDNKGPGATISNANSLKENTLSQHSNKSKT